MRENLDPRENIHSRPWWPRSGVVAHPPPDVRTLLGADGIRTAARPHWLAAGRTCRWDRAWEIDLCPRRSALV